MKHSSYLLRVPLAAAVALVGMAGTASASTTIAVRKCSVYACDSALSLKNEARVAYGNLPVGSIVFVSSQQYPLSAFVRICPGPRGGKDACLITSGDLGAVELDNEVYARAAVIEPIDIPIELGGSATQAIHDLVEGHILSILVATGRNGFSPLHNLFNPLTWPWMEFADQRTLTIHKVFAGDRITLKFADGSTVQAELIDIVAPSGHYFHIEWDSIRLPNGEPLVQPPSPPAATAGSGIQLTPPWLAGAFVDTLPFGYCAFLLSHCEFVLGNSVYDCYFRRQEVPCG